MDSSQSKREQNKARHRASILDAAEKLFLEKGFDNASIDDVAKEAKLTKRTLYQYFLSKEDLFYAVALKGARLLASACTEAMEHGGNALEKIRLSNEAYRQFYKDYPGLFRILNYRPSNRENCEASPHFLELGALDGFRMKLYFDLVERSKTDGSIKAGLDARKAVFFAFFTAFSLLFTVSGFDTNWWAMLELDEDDFLRFCFEMVADALTPLPKPLPPVVGGE